MFSIMKFIPRYYLKTGNKIALINFREMSASIDDFKKAKEKLGTLQNDPGSESKLKLYGLFKQATEGQCNKPKPGVINFVDRAKWEAWSTLTDMPKEKAMESYIQFVDQLCKEHGTAAAPEAGNADVKKKDIGLDVTNKNGVFTLRLNRVDKKNAITWEMYDYWTEMLNQADKDPSVRVAVITGSGDYFCSGNDLSNFTNIPPGESPQQMAKRGNKVLRNFVGGFIDFSKPLIGLVNGPAIGISVTTLGLYDMIIASDKATFSTPFSNLGQTPEGCSSYTFPLIFGPMKAREMIMFNRKLSANEAIGLVTCVFPEKVFHEEAWKIVNEIASLPPQTLRYCKELIRGPMKKELHEINKNECDRLMERWVSDECIQAITKFFSRKSA